MKLSEKLIKLRKEKGLSQEEFGNQINVSRQAVSKWENEEAKPDINKLKEIVKKFNVNYNYLLNDEIENKEETTKTVKTKHKKILKPILIVLLIYLLICTYKFIAMYRFYLIASSFSEENYKIMKEIKTSSNIFYRITTTKIGNKILQESYSPENKEPIKDKNENTLPYNIEYTDTDKKISYWLNYDKDKNMYIYHDRKKEMTNNKEKEELFKNKNIIKEDTLNIIPSGFKEIFIASIDPRYYYVSIQNRQIRNYSFANNVERKIQLNKDYLIENINHKFKDNGETATFHYDYDYVQDHFKEMQDPQEKYNDKILYNEK